MHKKRTNELGLSRELLGIILTFELNFKQISPKIQKIKHILIKHIESCQK